MHLEITEQDDLVNTWTEADHGQYLIKSSFYNVPYLKISDEADHADTTLAEGEEPYTYKAESTFNEQEAVFG